MEKEMKNCSTQASSQKITVEQNNLTKPERLVSNNLKHLSFAANLLALANQAAEEYAYEQEKPEMQQRAKSISTSHNKATRGLGVCKRFVGNSFFEDLLALANTASDAFHRQVSQVDGSDKEVNVAEVAKPKGDLSGGCREDRLFEKKYVRKKRVNKEQHLESTSVVAVARSFNLFKKLCVNKSSTLA